MAANLAAARASTVPLQRDASQVLLESESDSDEETIEVDPNLQPVVRKKKPPSTAGAKNAKVQLPMSCTRAIFRQWKRRRVDIPSICAAVVFFVLGLTLWLDRDEICADKVLACSVFGILLMIAAPVALGVYFAVTYCDRAD